MFSGKELRMLRVEKDIKQKDVAQKLGVTKSYVCMLERGKLLIPYEFGLRWYNLLKTWK